MSGGITGIGSYRRKEDLLVVRTVVPRSKKTTVVQRYRGQSVGQMCSGIEANLSLTSSPEFY